MHSRLDHQARIALMQAADEARDLGHPTLGPEHLLLGLLADRRSEAADVLLAHGLTFEGCREAVVTHHRDHPETDAADGPAGGPAGAAEDAGPAGAYDEDRKALRALGIDLDRVREAVRSTFGDDLAEGWGGRPDRRRGRGPRGPRGHGGAHGRGRRGPRGGGGPFGLPFRDSLKDVLRDLMRALAVERVDARLDARFEGRPGGRPESRSDGRSEGRGRRGPGRIPPARLVLALLDSPDPALRAAVAGLDVDAVRRALGERVEA